MEFHRGLVRSYDATTHTAAVLLTGSMSRVLLDLPVAQHVRPETISAGIPVGVLFFADGSHAVVVCTLDGQGISASCRVSKGSKNFTYATWAAFDFDTENWDPLAMHDNVTNNTRLTCQIPGKYHITAGISWGAASGGIRIMEIRHGTATVLAADRRTGFAWICATVSADWHFALGDYATIWAYHDTAGTLAAGAWASMTRTGP